MRTLLAAAMLALAFGTTSCRSLSSGPAAGKPTILCHYMTWFQWRQQNGVPRSDHWSWNGPGPVHNPNTIGAGGLRDICSVVYPRIGVYDSADPDVIDYHILTAKAAGIQGFVVDWYGPGNAVDDALQVLFDRAEALDFKVAICLEEKLCFPDWYAARDRQESTARAVELVSDVVKRYAGRPAYWRWHDRPVLFVFNGFGEWPGKGRKTFTGLEWSTIVHSANATQLYIAPQHFDLDGRFVHAAFGWVGGPEHARWVRQTGDHHVQAGLLDFYVAPASPGFDDHGVWGWGNGPRVDPYLGTETYDDYWGQIALGHAAAVQIATWNDFGEGTVIEPTVQWGHLFIDETERQVHKVTGRRVNLDDNLLPYTWLLLRKRLGDVPQVAAIHDALAAGNGARAKRLVEALITDNKLDLPLYVSANDETPSFAVWSDDGRRRETILNDIRRAGLMANTIVSASSAEDREHAPAAAADGNLATRWASSAADNQWLRVAWPQPVTARELVILWESAYASEFTVRLSADGEHWNDAATVTDGPGGVYRLPLNTGPFRFLQLDLKKRATKWGFSIHELGLLP